jgi:hypothetical protein
MLTIYEVRVHFLMCCYWFSCIDLHHRRLPQL